MLTWHALASGSLSPRKPTVSLERHVGNLAYTLVQHKTSGQTCTALRARGSIHLLVDVSGSLVVAVGEVSEKGEHLVVGTLPLGVLDEVLLRIRIVQAPKVFWRSMGVTLAMSSNRFSFLTMLVPLPGFVNAV